MPEGVGLTAAWSQHVKSHTEIPFWDHRANFHNSILYIAPPHLYNSHRADARIKEYTTTGTVGACKKYGLTVE